MRSPAQEKLIKLVEIQEEKKEQVKLKCWAGYATEEKMITELKYPASLPMHRYANMMSW